ncbi:MAG: hypothetical protein ACPGNT_10140 [Rhodospirillales bacterium]
MTALVRAMSAAAIGLLAGLGGAEAFPGDNKPPPGGFFKANTLACYNRETVKKYLDAERAGDLKPVTKLLAEDCLRVDGKPYGVIKAGFVSTKVNVIDQGRTLILYTPTRSLQ